MPIRAITFDCAQTLVEVDYQAEQFAVRVAKSIGIETPPNAADLYRGLFGERFPEFLSMNLRRSVEEGRNFYNSLNREWLLRMGANPERAAEMTEHAEEQAFGAGSSMFKLYEDTISALSELKSKGYRLAVISNWDYSLHRVLRMFGLEQFFDTAIASLEEGVEKPDPKIFQIALDRLACSPDEVFHVGDDPTDDLQGANNFGMRAALIARAEPPQIPLRIASLFQIPEAIACLG